MPVSSRVSHTLRGGALRVLLLLALLVAATQSFEVSPLLRGLTTTRELERIQQAQFTRTALEQIYALHESPYHTRRLTTSTDDAQARANEIGASVRRTVKNMRGGSDKFYRDLITAVKILLCQEQVKKAGSADNPKNRFVDASDSLAYKDNDGKCILVTLSASSDDTMRTQYTVNQKCEVKPNCYWREIDPLTDVDRIPVYATDQSAQPPDGAMTYDDAKDKAMKWAQGLMIFVLPGIILAVLSLLTMVFFLMCRCCCNRCGGRSPKEGGYTCISKFLPVLFFLLFSIGIVVVAAVSLLYQKTVTSAITDTFDATSETLTNASSWINDIQTPLEKIRDKVVTSADSVSLQLADTGFIDEGITSLTTALGDFEAGSANRTLPAGCTVDENEDPPLCVPCTFCTSISSEVATAKKQIEDNAGPGVAALQEVKVTLNEKLVDIKDTVRSNVNEQVENTDEFIVTINDTQKKVDDIHDKFDGQKEAQKAGVLVLFALALIVIALGLIGILLGLTPLKMLANVIHIAYFIGFIALILMFLVSSIFLAVSVILGDACEITMIFTEDWTVPLGDAAKGVNACFHNESLIDVLELGDSLDFARGGIKFPEPINTSTLLDFSSLDSFATEINAVDESTFPVNQNGLNSLMQAMNDYTKQANNMCVINDGNYDESNILTPWDANGGTKGGATTALEYITLRYNPYDTDCSPQTSGKQFMCTDSAGNSPTACDFHVFISDLYTKVGTLVAIKRDAKAFVVELKANMKVVTETTATFKDKTKDMSDKITDIQDDLQSSLIKYVADFEKAMYCTFIMDGFFDIYGALCGDLMPAFTMISLMLFLAGVFLFPVNICLIIALKRLKARGNGSLDGLDNEMKFK